VSAAVPGRGSTPAAAQEAALPGQVAASSRPHGPHMDRPGAQARSSVGAAARPDLWQAAGGWPKVGSLIAWFAVGFSFFALVQRPRVRFSSDSRP
jgi:hypothetical protein